jgi:hypothetical protein
VPPAARSRPLRRDPSALGEPVPWVSGLPVKCRNATWTEPIRTCTECHADMLGLDVMLETKQFLTVRCGAFTHIGSVRLA